MKKNRDPSIEAKMKNIARYSRIVEKMRKKGIKDEEIEFLLDFQTKDALHVADLAAKSEAHEQEQKTRQLARN